VSSELTIAQIFAYVTLTVTGLTVAVVSLVFLYRQNFGWKPIVLVVSKGLRGKGGEDTVLLIFEFEAWNRRNYPIVIRRASLDFENIKFLRNPEWNKKTMNSIYRVDLLIAETS